MTLYAQIALLDFYNPVLAVHKYVIHSVLLVNRITFFPKKACVNSNCVLEFSIRQFQVTIFKIPIEQLVPAVSNVESKQSIYMLPTNTS